MFQSSFVCLKNKMFVLIFNNLCKFNFHFFHSMSKTSPLDVAIIATAYVKGRITKVRIIIFTLVQKMFL